MRPLTDNISVLAPEKVDYTISLTYYIASDNKTQATAIQNAVNAAVDNYVLWQKSKLGRDINPSELIVRVMAAGAKRVAVTSPVFKVTTDTQVAICSTKTVTLGGIEDA